MGSQREQTVVMHRPKHSKLWHGVPRLAFWYRWCLHLHSRRMMLLAIVRLTRALPNMESIPRRHQTLTVMRRRAASLASLVVFKARLHPRHKSHWMSLKILILPQRMRKRSRFRAYLHAPERS